MILFHVCCAPCSLALIENLLKIYEPKEICLYFYNPNIFSEPEYQNRLQAVKKMAELYQLKLFEGKYDHQAWLKYLISHLEKSPENYAENDARCFKCFDYRLAKAFEFAKNNNFDAWAVSLSVNRFKNTRYINKSAEFLTKKSGLKYHLFQIDSHQSHQRAQELVKKYHLYSQKYCGCEFSSNSFSGK